MRHIFIFIVWLCATFMTLPALGQQPQKEQQSKTPTEGRLSKEAFRARQQAYITEKASLTVDEATRFFPLYFELQDRKQELNDASWKLMREARDKKKTLSESRYEEILETTYDNRLECDRLDKSYFAKFKKILSCQKLFHVHRAEMRFHRELVRDMHRGGRQKAHHAKPVQK